ncbi:MFS transporter, DHA2 family, methylenomycin A resistance protein [Collimonas sp. OK307]|uniref:MFS transporter n=1 Tax=Collimonas sp. OK307 TaxID=1801620 RepID=UPI0008EBD93E|nr:MFS transporter [Collimonas sp. OK307]SFI30258.1 MFS transporter, DHA2 family, methylenomycin A resistance protein [Collimonas sp. OK307]
MDESAEAGMCWVASDKQRLQRRVLAATSLSYAVVILDTSIVNVALERISGALATDIAGLQWVVNAYILSFASLLLTGGTLADRYGARNVYLAGLAVFTLASAWCGVADELGVLIMARVLQGCGAALLLPASLTLIKHVFPDAGERAAAIGIWAGCGGAAMAAGPLAGGILIHFFDWRSIFLANLPFGLLGIWLTWRIGRDYKPALARRLDPGGQCTAILALGALVAVLIEGPVLGWHNLPIVAGMVLGFGAGSIFLALQSRRKDAMLPLSFFRNGAFSGSALVSMVSALTFYGLVFVLSLYFQQVQGYSPLRTGLAFLPLTALVTAGSMVSNRMVKSYGPRRLVSAALVCYAIGFLGLLASISTATSSYWLLVLPMPAIGFAAGLITPAATAALMAAVEPERAGVAAGVLNSARQTGAALGVAVFGGLITAVRPFEAGLHLALWASAALALAAALVWRRASKED